MRVHSSLSPRYNHFAALSGGGFDNIQAYKGKGGAIFNLSDRRRKAIKAAAIAAAMAAAAAAGAHHLNKRAAGKKAGWPDLDTTGLDLTPDFALDYGVQHIGKDGWIRNVPSV